VILGVFSKGKQCVLWGGQYGIYNYIKTEMQTLKKYYRHNITDQIADDKNKLWEHVEKIEARSIARRLVTWSLKEKGCWKME
jgi:hypothetical protein